MTGPALKRVYIDIDPVLHKKAKMIADRKGVTLKGWLEELILKSAKRVRR